MVRELKKADLLISGGGSLLQDVTGPLSIPYYLGVSALAKLIGTPVVFYAQGIGPVNGWLNKKLIKSIANRVDLITLRDEDSEVFLDELGVHQAPVTVTADPVFSMRAGSHNLTYGREYLNTLGLGDEQNIIGVSLRPWSRFDDAQLAEFLDSLAAMGHSILLLPLQFPEDLNQVKRVRALMAQPSFIADKPMGSADLIGLISYFKVLVGMRLHSLIFAACAGVPFEGIAYDPKVDSLLALFGKQPIISGAAFDINSALVALDQTLQNAMPASEDVRSRADELKVKSDNTARLVLSVLNEK